MSNMSADAMRAAGLRGARKGAKVAARVRREYAVMADQRYGIGPFIIALRAAGWSLQRVADELTARGLPTRKQFCSAQRWHPTQVARIIGRALDDAPATIARLEAEAQALRTVWEREGRRTNNDRLPIADLRAAHRRGPQNAAPK
jgi:hypothetical protein